MPSPFFPRFRSCVRTILFGLTLAFHPAGSAEAANAAQPDAADARAKFQSQLAEAADSSVFEIGVAVRNLATKETLAVNGGTAFSQAGLSKLHVLIPLFREASQRRIDLSEQHTLRASDKLPGGVLQRLGDDTVTMSLRDYTALMCIMDDNSAAKILLDKLGRAPIDSYLAELNNPDIHFAGLVSDPKNPDDNTATPLALLDCLSQLYGGKLVDDRSREEIFKLLATPRVSTLRSSVPPDIKIVSKSGFRGPIRCSAGMVFLDSNPYAIVIMIRPRTGQPPRPNQTTESKIAAIAKLAYAYYSGKK